MNAKKTVAAALVALSALAATPASAGSGLSIEFGHGSHFGPGWHQQRFSPQEVRWMLRDRNYRQINFVDRRGSTYRLTARKGGRHYFVVVSAFSGQIVHRHRI